LRDNKLRCLTSDHTLAMLQLKRGDLSQEDYKTSPYKKTLTQAIGVTPELRPDIAEVRVANGDLLLLCSDGLHRMVSDRQITEILTSGDDSVSLDERAANLVMAANEAGGKDNITVHLVPVVTAGVETESNRVHARKQRVDVARVLGKCILFETLSDAERLLIAPYFEYQAFDAGDVVCREGDSGDSLYVVVQGRIRITFQRAHLIDIGPGGWAGEIALAREGVRTATLTARDKVVLLVLTRARFHEIMRRRPTLGTQLALPLIDFVGKRIIDLRARFEKIYELMRGQARGEPTT
jgi:CRP-like cAMP-binding protein